MAVTKNSFLVGLLAFLCLSLSSANRVLKNNDAEKELKATFPNSVLLVQDMVIAVVTVAALVVGDILILLTTDLVVEALLLTTDLVVEALVANLATLIRRVRGRDARDFKGAKDVKEGAKDVKEDAKDARHHIHLVPSKSARLTTLRSKMNLFPWVKNLNHQSCQKIIT